MRNAAMLLAFLCLASTACTCDGSEVSNKSGSFATDLSEDRLTFDDVIFERKETQSFLLYNDGGSPITIGSIALIGEQKKYFQLLDLPAMPFTLAPGKAEGRELKVQFTAQATFAIVARIQIASDDASNANQDGFFYVQLANRLKVGKLHISCGSNLDMEEVLYGRSRTKICKIQNPGTGDVTLKGVQFHPQKGLAKEFRLEGLVFPARLRSSLGDTLSFRIVYKPLDFDTLEDSGRFEFSTDIAHKRGETEPYIKVKGKTGARLIEVMPMHEECNTADDCDFRDPSMLCRFDRFRGITTCQSTASSILLKFLYTPTGLPKETNLEVRSVGSLPVVLDEVRFLKGDQKRFEVIPPRRLPQVLYPLERTGVRVTYRSANQGRVYGTLAVYSNAHNGEEIKVKLDGDTAECRFRLSSTRVTLRGGVLNFGNVVLGKSRSAGLLLRSVGGSHCTLRSFRLQPLNEASKGAFRITGQPQTPEVIFHGGSAGLQVFFEPKIYGDSFNARLLIESTDGRQKQISVRLRGLSLNSASCLGVFPPKLDFGSPRLGCGMQETRVTLKNRASATCSGLSIQSIKLFDAPGVSYSFREELPHTLLPGKSMEVRVFFSSIRPVKTTGALLIQPRAPHPIWSLPISGERIADRHVKEIFAQGPTMAREFPLKGLAASEEMLVRVDGDLWVSPRWSYDFKRNVLIFPESHTPPKGASIEVFYYTRCE